MEFPVRNGVGLVQPDITLHIDGQGVIREANSFGIPDEVVGAWVGRSWFDTVGETSGDKIQRMIDEPNAWGSYGYDKGAYLADLTDDVIDVLTTYVARKASPLSLLIFYWLDGAYAEVPEQATAFSGPRTPCYFGNFIALCPDQEMLPAERQWIRELSDDLRPYALGSMTYVNVTPEPDASEVQDVYGAKFSRLQDIKATYDPDNVFHRNANIRPAASMATSAT